MSDIMQTLEARLDVTETDSEIMQRAFDEIKSLKLKLVTAQHRGARKPTVVDTDGPLWKGKGEKLTDYDIPRIGYAIGVGEDEIHAVLEVESKGYGFDNRGEVIHLFEEHVFYRQLPKALRQKAMSKGIAYPKWRKNYKNNHAKFLKAFEFHPEAALLACSWGLGQVMGFNYRMVGYETVEQMVVDFAVSEGNQLEAMVEFIKAAGLDDELKAHDWAGFARGYNGKGYRRNRYDQRLRSSFAKWSRIKDTPWTPVMAEEESATNGLSEL